MYHLQDDGTATGAANNVKQWLITRDEKDWDKWNDALANASTYSTQQALIQDALHHSEEEGEHEFTVDVSSMQRNDLVFSVFRRRYNKWEDARAMAFQFVQLCHETARLNFSTLDGYAFSFTRHEAGKTATLPDLNSPDHDWTQFLQTPAYQHNSLSEEQLRVFVLLRMIAIHKELYDVAVIPGEVQNFHDYYNFYDEPTLQDELNKLVREVKFEYTTKMNESCMCT